MENNIGERIRDLRKEQGVTQEQLAEAVGVSAQAVSKWECGGSPDIELLAGIADTLNVSIDRLFGRSVSDYGGIDSETAKYLASFEAKDRIEKAFAHCWGMQLGLFGSQSGLTDENTLKKTKEGHDGTHHSMVINDYGISIMSFGTDPQYFILMPEPESGWRGCLPGAGEYRALFAALAEPDVIECLYFLHNWGGKQFTPNLLERECSLAPGRAEVVLALLKNYQLVSTSEIEIDDAARTVYRFNANPELIALLSVAVHVINRPHCYSYHNYDRLKPYFV